MTKWERMANRLEYFKGKDITELSEEEIKEFLEIKEECRKIAESLNKLVVEPFAKAVANFFEHIKGLK